ncbi:hypothetical protein [Methylobrevis pamukkalensis]|uniref:Uncharacterized protein n=1 Tax=Methylobrevis pamukkalensis TaxID=1439726 RepID=A0A1E3GZX3_9HYPH|nr:hypothetical protein [Methylobrevis pamukkalensis]ODN69116.1 hypothetical protein A6302_03587 [Methylobrevis pamukkalensis]
MGKLQERVRHAATGNRANERYCEIERTCGSRDHLVATLQRRYGVDARHAEAWVEAWADAIDDRGQGRQMARH